MLVAVSLLFAPGCASSEQGAANDPVESEIESDPTGASVYFDGDFIGITPLKLELPAFDRIRVRVEKAGYHFSELEVVRKKGTPPDAPRGVGWDPVYYFPLDPIPR